MPPPVVVVSGFPAAGKTTLSRRLGADLGFVVVSRDRLYRDAKLRDLQLALPVDRQTMVPAAIDRLVNFMVTSAVEAGHGAIVDGNFNWVEQRRPVRALLAELQPPCAEICLWGDATVLKDRFAQRGEPPMDDHLSQAFDRAVSREREPVLRHTVPTFEFDTTDLRCLDDAYGDLICSLRDAFGGFSAGR